MKKVLLNVVALMFLSVSLFAQKKISGKVTDENGTPIVGASIIVKGTKIGTTTDENGNYSITVPEGSKSIIVTSVGQADKEIAVATSGIITITMTSKVDSGEDVVVIGYGTQQKKTFTGSLTSIKGDAVANKPVQTFDQALAGKSTGVQITSPNGVLNSPPVFRIRGTNSISLSSYPLIIVDGVPSYTGDYSGGYSSGNALGSINPEDIESIDIAKDAAATAIYGSRAANGVVFVTTKKGKKGKAKVGYSGWVSIANAWRLPEVLNGEQYLDYKTKAIANNPTMSAWSFESVKGADGKPIYTDWSDVVYRQGISHNHAVNVSGSSENTSYYFSVGYSDQQGIIKKNDFKRLNTLLNIESKLTNKLTLGGKISYSNEKNLAATSSGSLSGEAFSTAGLGRIAVVLPPILTPYNADGSYNLNGSAIGSPNIKGTANLGYFNPVVNLENNYGNSENSRIQSNVFLQYKPIKSITLKTAYGIDNLVVDDNIFWSPKGGDGYSYGGYATSAYSKYNTWLWTNTATWANTFGDHSVDVLIGNEQQRRTSSGYGINRQNLSDKDYNVTQAGFTNNNPAGMGLGENYLLSTFGRVNYSFQNKYFLSGNIRQDEYSALGEKKGIFWGASAGWDITKENFWSNIRNSVSTFKLRGSFGRVGNTGIGDYAAFSTFGSGLYGGQATLVFSSVGNNILKWETSNKFDLGLNWGLFNDKVSGEISVYKNSINEMILNVPQAPSTGLPNSPAANVGKMYNQGVEFSISARPVENKNFTWSTNFNFTFNKNEVTGLADGLTNITTSTSSSETVNRTEVGKSLGYLWVVRTGGVDPETGKRIYLNSAGTPVYYQFYAPAGEFNYSLTPDGKTRYVGPDGATTINQASDAVMYANSIPKYYGGWDNTFTMGNFDLNVLMTYQGGYSIYYGSNAGLHDQRWWNNHVDVLTDAWMAKGETGKKYAKPVFGDNVSNGSALPMDINVFKGDFLKLKSVTLGYNIPKKALNTLKISNARIYVSSANLAVFTKYPGPDPEVSSNGNSNLGQGVDRNTVANARTFLIGVNVGF